jgi:hypothetical protein
MMTTSATSASTRGWSSAVGCYEAFELLQVVDIVAGHSFYDGPEGHGAALGVSGGAVAVFLRDGGEEEQVPVAGCLEEGETGFKVVGGVAFAPGFLVEGLDDGVGLVELGCEGLAEAEAEDDLAVSQVGDDFADAPLARGRGSIDLGSGQAGSEGLETLGGGGQDGDRVLSVKVLGVGV